MAHCIILCGGHLHTEKKGYDKMKYGYIRVSSKSQKDNNSLKEQRALVLEAGADEVVEEVYTGGTIKERPLFSELIKRLEPNDTLIVCKLDRFARTVVEGTALAQELYERNITLNILNMGSIEHTPIGTLLLNVMLSFAQFEKEMINSRCQAGREYAREHNPNYKEGRPKKFNRDQINLALDLLSQGKTYKQVESMTGISKSTIVRAKRHTTFDTDL